MAVWGFGGGTIVAIVRTESIVGDSSVDFGRCPPAVRGGPRTTCVDDARWKELVLQEKGWNLDKRSKGIDKR